MAKAGNDKAQHALGVMYQRGQGVIQDYKGELKWFTKAADLGYPAAQFNLGLLFHEGHGVAQDYKEALRWFTKAAERCLPKVRELLKVAYVWFQLAAAHGSQNAVRNRDLVEKHMTRSQIQQAQRIAKEWTEKEGG